MLDFQLHWLAGRLAYENRLIGKEDVPGFSLACLQGLLSGLIDDVWFQITTDRDGHPQLP